MPNRKEQEGRMKITKKQKKKGEGGEKDWSERGGGIRENKEMREK